MRSRSKTIVSATLGVALAVGTGAPLYALADDEANQISDSASAGYVSDEVLDVDIPSDVPVSDSGVADSPVYDDGSAESFVYDDVAMDSSVYDTSYSDDTYVQDESSSYDMNVQDDAVDSNALYTSEDVVYDPFDLDGDGILDMLDLDGDGIPDAEDFDHDGLPDDPKLSSPVSKRNGTSSASGSALELQGDLAVASSEPDQSTGAESGSQVGGSDDSSTPSQDQVQDGESASGTDAGEETADGDGTQSADGTQVDDADGKAAEGAGTDAKDGKDAAAKGKDGKDADAKGDDGKDSKGKDADAKGKDAKDSKDGDSEGKNEDVKIASSSEAKEAAAAKDAVSVAASVNTNASESGGLVAAVFDQPISESDKAPATELESTPDSDNNSQNASPLESEPAIETITPNADALTPEYEAVDASTFAGLPSRSVNLTTAKFIATIGEQARAVAQNNDLYASVLIAQAVIESGNGNSLLAQAPNYNLFGIKGSYKGKSAVMPTEEDDGSGNLYGIMAEFRRYNSRAESIADYADLLRSNPQWYAEAYKSNAATYVDACKALQGRYATSTTYAATLTSVIETYDLTRYDKPLDFAVSGSIHDPDSELSDKNGYRDLTMDDYARLESLACSFLGTDYVWGGDSPATGFDCSGLVQWCMREAMGIELPRTTFAQQLVGKRVKVDPKELRMGDLLFFNTPGEGTGHVAMYLSDGFYIHAPETGDVIKVTSIEEFTPSFANRVIDEIDLNSNGQVVAGLQNESDGKVNTKSSVKYSTKDSSKDKAKSSSASKAAEKKNAKSATGKSAKASSKSDAKADAKSSSKSSSKLDAKADAKGKTESK